LISTALVAVFTGILTWYTILLWKSGEKHSERELRAYIGIDAADFSESQDGKTKAEIHIKNAGQTPAYDVLVRARFHFYSLPHDDFPEPTPEQQSKVTLFPDCSVTVPVIMETTVSDGNKKAIVAGKSAFFFYGAIKYRDAFGNNRFTNFRFIADDDKSGALRWRATEKGNDAS